ncbi:MAG: NUDIX hydrolase [Deltaproteobacteria bacterium]|nr:MAG: NUDIX hydrolase [Deltaproteobacteria bacterium]
MTVKRWEIISSKPNDSYGIFSFRTDRARSPRTGLTYDCYILESTPWVNVIALTPHEEVILVRQYRHGIRDLTMEIPGGLVDAHDTPEAAARRELREETGYQSDEWIPLGSVFPNPAIQNNRCYTFLARDVVYSGQQQLDEMEDIEVLYRPLKEIPDLIRGGEINHSLVLAAFFKYYLMQDTHNLLILKI